MTDITRLPGVGNVAGSYRYMTVSVGQELTEIQSPTRRKSLSLMDKIASSLKRFKDEVKEVKGGYECGLVFEDFGNIQEGDIVVASEMVEIPR